MNAGLIILAVAAAAYLVIRFVLLPWLGPMRADAIGKKALGRGYEQARQMGATLPEAFAAGKKAKRDEDDRALAKESGVPLDVIRAFRSEHPEMGLRAEVLPESATGARYRIRGGDPEVDGYSGSSTQALYRADRTRVAPDHADDADDDESAIPSPSWDELPEKVRTAARNAVPGGEFTEAAPPDEAEPFYEIHFAAPAKSWVVEVNPDGTVRRSLSRPKARGVDESETGVSSWGAASSRRVESDDSEALR